MRSQFFILALCFESLFLFGSKAQALLLESRGFKTGFCYSHFVKIKKEKKTCHLEVFPENKFRLSMVLDKCPQEKVPDQWIYARFKLLQIKEKYSAKLIEWTPVDPRIGNTMGDVDRGFAQPGRCK